MSCRKKDSLVSGGREAEFAAHSAGCPECAALGRQVDEIAAVTGALAAPAMTKGLRASLIEIPRRTVSCEGADLLLAQVFEAEIAAQDEARWKSHLSRCSACSEAAEALFAARGLAAPVPAPWLGTRLAAASRSADAGTRPASAGRAGTGFWALLWSPKGAIGLAYAAAVAVMLTGFNPADLARKAGIARLEDATGMAVAAARSGAVERIGALEDRAYRAIESWKGRLVGYGRATLENALALVMRTEPRRSPDRSNTKSGESNGIPRTNDGASLAGKPVPSAAPITTWRT